VLPYHVSSLSEDEKVIGHEMEVSTFLHFTRKHAMKSGVLLYVSDNERHSIINTAKEATAANRIALRTVSSVAVTVLQVSEQVHMLNSEDGRANLHT
jgi:nucleoside phosphorylase